MTTYENNLELAAKAIRDNGGVAPKSIRRVKLAQRRLFNGSLGYKGQVGYEVGGKLYATVAQILSADKDAERRYEADSTDAEQHEYDLLG